MLEEALRNRGVLLFACTYGALLGVAGCELVFERRPLAHPIARRWVSNVSLGFLDRALVRWAMPVGVFSVALWNVEQGSGLLRWLAAPPLPGALASVVLLDLAAYAVHRLHHAVPPLWQLHRLHHADLDLDFSTTHRHHPLESLVSTSLLVAATAAIGADPAGVLLYFALRGGIEAFSHGNLRVPPRVDRALRALLVTPAMHAVHHSAVREETDANFGTVLSVWDRLFATHREAPARGYGGMTLGLEAFRTPRDLDLDRMLAQPFRRG